MKNRTDYIKPEVEIIEVNLENTIMNASGNTYFDLDDVDTVTGSANSRKRGLWDDN